MSDIATATGGAVHSGPALRVGTLEFAWRPGAVITIGRDAGCDVVVPDPRVSRRHASVAAAADGTWRLRDMGSQNGIFLAGRRVGDERVAATVQIHLGAPDGAAVTIELLPLPSAADGPARTARQAGMSSQMPLGGLSKLSERRLGRSVASFAPVRDVVTIGRDPANDVVLTGDLRASRRHAELRRLADGWEMHDLGSGHGTFVNGTRAGRARLADGDLLTLGSHVFLFHQGQLEQISEADDTSLDVTGLSVTVPAGDTLLREVSFSLPSRSVLAVVGPSGAGKSTLLRTLTGTMVPSQGQVSFAGRDLHACYEEFRAKIGVVPQDDLVHPELTARSELELAAALRLPPDTSRDDRRIRAQQVLGELGLAQRADLPIAKLSGGQRKRVSVGTELLTQPTLLFLDEPTSGLDPGNEKQVMSVLRQLADGGRVVVVVTHATQSLDLADRVLFLARGGQVAYFGPPAESLAYFAQHGVTGGYADIFRVLDEPGGTDWAALFQADPDHDRYVGIAVRQAAVRRDAAARRPAPRSASPVPARDQFRVLVRRQLKILGADRRTLLLLGAQPLAFGVLMLGLFTSYTLSTEQGPMASLLLWLLVISATWLGASATIREIVKELPVYRRERAVGLSLPAYVGAKFAVFGGITVVQSLAVVVIGLWRQSLPPQDHKGFVPLLVRAGTQLAPASYRGLRPFTVGSVLSSQRLEIAVAIALTGLAGTALGLAISALVRKSDQAVFLLPVLLMVEMALSLPLLQLQNPHALVGQIGKLTGAGWGMSAVASTVSLNQLMAPYLFDLTFGKAQIAGAFAGHQGPPRPPEIIRALQGSALWQHTGSTWITAVLVLVVMAAVLLAVAGLALRRLDLGRRTVPGRRQRAHG